MGKGAGLVGWTRLDWRDWLGRRWYLWRTPLFFGTVGTRVAQLVGVDRSHGYLGCALMLGRVIGGGGAIGAVESEILVVVQWDGERSVEGAAGGRERRRGEGGESEGKVASTSDGGALVFFLGVFGGPGTGVEEALQDTSVMYMYMYML